MRWGSTLADCLEKDDVDVKVPSCAFPPSQIRLPAILNRAPCFLVRWDLHRTQPVLTLKMTGESASLQSVRMEIIQRIQRNFMLSTLRVEFAP